MRTFTVLFRPGPSWKADTSIYHQDLVAHGEYHQAAFLEGRILVAGPFNV